MNSEDLSLVKVIVGPRGGNKTLLMTGMEIESLGRAAAINKLRELTNNPGLYPRKKVNIWSNYPVEGLYRLPGSPQPIKVKSLEIEVPRLITWREEFRDGIIFWDEIDQDLDRQDWMAQAARFIIKGVKLMRHRNITLVASLQFIDELNVRLYKQADMIIQCRDKAFTPWGKENKLELGMVASTSWIDKSGIMTGYSYEETHQVYYRDFYGQRYWGNYKTKHEFDVMKPKYKITQDVYEISNFEQYEQKQKQYDAIEKAVEYFQYERPGEPISSADMGMKAEEFGCKLAGVSRARYLKEIGAKVAGKHGSSNYYDLSNVIIEDKEEVK